MTTEKQRETVVAELRTRTAKSDKNGNPFYELSLVDDPTSQYPDHVYRWFGDTCTQAATLEVGSAYRWLVELSPAPNGGTYRNILGVQGEAELTNPADVAKQTPPQLRTPEQPANTGRVSQRAQRVQIDPTRHSIERQSAGNVATKVLLARVQFDPEFDIKEWAGFWMEWSDMTYGSYAIAEPEPEEEVESEPSFDDLPSASESPPDSGKAIFDFLGKAQDVHNLNWEGTLRWLGYTDSSELSGKNLTSEWRRLESLLEAASAEAQA